MFEFQPGKLCSIHDRLQSGEMDEARAACILLNILTAGYSLRSIG